MWKIPFLYSPCSEYLPMDVFVKEGMEKKENEEIQFFSWIMVSNLFTRTCRIVGSRNGFKSMREKEKKYLLAQINLIIK